MTHTVFVSVGSNIGDRVKNCRKALDMLGSFSDVSLNRVSSFYKTAPVGCLNQGWFVNCAATFVTSLEPASVLAVLLSTEKKMGRKRGRRWGERIIDIDLLLYDDQVIQSDFLTIPHPRMHERAFVLVPLAEISPGLAHPVFKKTFFSMITGVAGQEIFQIRDK